MQPIFAEFIEEQYRDNFLEFITKEKICNMTSNQIETTSPTDTFRRILHLKDVKLRNYLLCFLNVRKFAGISLYKEILSRVNVSLTKEERAIVNDFNSNYATTILKDFKSFEKERTKKKNEEYDISSSTYYKGLNPFKIMSLFKDFEENNYSCLQDFKDKKDLSSHSFEALESYLIDNSFDYEVNLISNLREKGKEKQKNNFIAIRVVIEKFLNKIEYGIYEGDVLREYTPFDFYMEWKGSLKKFEVYLKASKLTKTYKASKFLKSLETTTISGDEFLKTSFKFKNGEEWTEANMEQKKKVLDFLISNHIPLQPRFLNKLLKEEMGI